MVKRPEGMPPWWGKQIVCPHCGVFIRSFTPKEPGRWERELEAITKLAGERCYCRKSAEEIRALMAEPEQPFKEHTLYRVWLSHALQYRIRECGEKVRVSDEWKPPERAPGWATKPRSKGRKK